MVLMRLIGRLLRLRAPGGEPAAGPAPTPDPGGLLGRDWRAWRHTVLRELSDSAAEPLSYTFVAGYSAAYARLADATVDRSIDVATWGRIGADLDHYTSALRDGAGGGRPFAGHGRPAHGDLGRRPSTPLPGGMLDLGIYVEPERGLS